jgi:hypothetical protein
MQCKQCGQDYKAKRNTSSYCSPKCKQEFYRNRIRPVVTLRDAKPVTVTKGKCWCCGKDIAPILVCCQECAWSGKAAAKRAGAHPPLFTDRTPKEMETDLHTLKLTGDYKLTDYEREHYKPASQLLPGQVNPVSKPGDEHYV